MKLTKNRLKEIIREEIQKIGGGHLLNEYNDKVADYSIKLGDYIEKKLRPKIGKLTFGVEHMTGSWYWEDRKSDFLVYATLGWEGKNEVPIEVADPHDVVKTLKYNLSFDMKKDVKWYLSNMKRYLPGIYKDWVKN
tara:strand:- start:479 stop:886 length:408 start_codon:yes stop_codon:yes gene_type:complete